MPDGVNDTNEESPAEDYIPAVIRPYYNTLTDEEKRTLQAIFIGIEVRISETASSPFPPPELLGDYNKVAPGVSDTIIDEIRIEARHRREIASLKASTIAKVAIRGQYFGLVIGLAFLVVAAVVILMGHSVAGTIIGTVDIVSLVALFVIGKIAKNNNGFFEEDEENS